MLEENVYLLSLYMYRVKYIISDNIEIDICGYERGKKE